MIKIDDYPFLMRVLKPSRYIGGEINEVIKRENDLFNVAICFPEVYEIAMSNLGISILYSILNDREGIWAQRCFMPHSDFENELIKNKIFLYALESGKPLKNFDLIGFSLQHELNYTNVLSMMKLGGIPIKSRERSDESPVIIAGGPNSVNPEPLSDFIDAFFIGEGEEGFVEICDALKNLKGRKRIKKLETISKIEGVYVPSFFETEFVDGRLVVKNSKKKIKKRIIKNLEKFPLPVNVIIPNHRIIHDRYPFELSRGCVFGCRFCQAGYTYRPLRHRQVDTTLKAIEEIVQKTGFSEVSLLSLNTGEYPKINELLDSLKDFSFQNDIDISLPSLRVSSIKDEILKSFDKKKKMAFTIAPEAGSERLRKVINKRIGNDEIFNAARTIFSSGFSNIKLYFILGLPTETFEDVKEIATLAKEIYSIGEKMRVKRLNITVSTSSFVPKPFTPFQWERMEDTKSLFSKQDYLKKHLGGRIKYRWHDVETSIVESILSRGDRSIGKIIENAFTLGAKNDSWAEFFDFEKYIEAFKIENLDLFDYLNKAFNVGGKLPWDFIDIGVSEKFLIDERERAFIGESTETCGKNLCFSCGSFRPLCIETEEVKDSEYKLPILQVEGEEKWFRGKFQKLSPSHLISHLDLIKVFERSFRRSGIKIAYSKGFHPFPELEIASPLPLGIEGENELIDFLARIPFNFDISIINESLPKGIKFKEIREKVADENALNEFIISDYLIDFSKLFTKSEDILEKLRLFSESDDFSIEVKSKGRRKTIDLKKRVLNVNVEGDKIFIKIIQGGIFKVLEVFINKEEIPFIQIKRSELLLK